MKPKAAKSAEAMRRALSPLNAIHRELERICRAAVRVRVKVEKLKAREVAREKAKP